MDGSTDLPRDAKLTFHFIAARRAASRRTRDALDEWTQILVDSPIRSTSTERDRLDLCIFFHDSTTPSAFTAIRISGRATFASANRRLVPFDAFGFDKSRLGRRLALPESTLLRLESRGLSNRTGSANSSGRANLLVSRLLFVDVDKRRLGRRLVFMNQYTIVKKRGPGRRIDVRRVKSAAGSLTHQFAL